MSTDDNLEKTLMDLWVTDPHEVAYTIVVPEAKASIKAESLRIALEIIGKDEVIPVEELHLGGLSQEYYDKRNKLRAELRKAFEDRYSK